MIKSNEDGGHEDLGCFGSRIKSLVLNWLPLVVVAIERITFFFPN